MAKNRKAKSKNSVTVAAVQATVDPALKKRYGELLAEINGAASDEMHGWDRKYEAAGEVLDKKLFLLSPYGTAEKWSLAVLKEKYRSASRNVRIARYCSPDDEVRYGTSKLDAFLAWADSKTHGGTTPVKMALAAVRIPVKRGGKAMRVSLAEATVVEVVAASKSDQSGTKHARRSPVEAAFVAPLAKDKELRTITVRVSDGKAHFGGVPLTALDRFLKAVRGVDWRSALPKG